MTSIILIVTGIGVGPNFNSLLIPIHASFDETSPASDVALSASAYAFVRAIGSSLGISVAGLICFEELGQLSSNDGHVSVTQAIEIVQGVAGSGQEKAIIIFQTAMNHVFIEIAVLMGVGFLMSLLIQRHTLGDAVRSNQRVGTKKRRKDDHEV